MDLSQWRSIPRHDLSAAFGDMGEAEFESLLADMKQHGYDNRQQVLLYEGKVLDGWHRLRAGVMTGKTPTFENYKGADPLGEVIRRNLTRRHYDASQRGLIAGRIATYRHGGNRKVQDTNLSLEKAAEQMKVHPNTARAGKKVAEKATPEVQEAVMDGTISVADAAAVSSEEPEVQNAAVDAVKKGKARTAKAAAASPKKPKSGQAKFDDRNIDKLIGKLVRSFDDRSGAFGKTAQYKDCIKAMDLLVAAWKRWQKEAA